MRFHYSFRSIAWPLVTFMLAIFIPGIANAETKIGCASLACKIMCHEVGGLQHGPICIINALKEAGSSQASQRSRRASGKDSGDAAPDKEMLTAMKARDIGDVQHSTVVVECVSQACRTMCAEVGGEFIGRKLCKIGLEQEKAASDKSGRN